VSYTDTASWDGISTHDATIGHKALGHPSYLDSRVQGKEMPESLISDQLFPTGHLDFAQAASSTIEEPISQSDSRFAGCVDALLASLDQWNDDEVKSEDLPGDIVDERLIDLFFEDELD
jgi:hypothetical protein